MSFSSMYGTPADATSDDARLWVVSSRSETPSTLL